MSDAKMLSQLTKAVLWLTGLVIPAVLLIFWGGRSIVAGGSVVLLGAFWGMGQHYIQTVGDALSERLESAELGETR